MPRTPRRLAALLLAGATLASLAACAPAEPEPTTPPPPVDSATDEPIFASDEEALAAAVAAYEAYLEASDAITADSGANSDRIRAVTTQSFAKQSEADFAAFAKAGLRTEGSTTIDSPRLIEASGGGRFVEMYACQDVSGVTVFNAAGDDVTPGDRDDRIPLIVRTKEGDARLVVDGSQVWSGDNFC